MLISRIQGGLGNQMFQYAYGRHLSNKFNLSFHQELSFYDNQGVVVRKFLLDKLENTNINLNIINNGKKFLRVDDNTPLNIIIDDNNNYYIDGYFQSEIFFKESENIIRLDFSLSEKRKRNILQKYPELTTNTVSLHIRRTDYITMGRDRDCTNEYYIVQPVEYYKKALDIIGNYDYLFIISDDIQWCKNNLKFDNSIFVEGNNDITDMYIMSLCKNNIIANSTFSWWGAWLNSNYNKKIISPIDWYGPKLSQNTDNLIPNDWIKI